MALNNYRYELLNISNTHNAIADWLIANPGRGQLGRCAAVFGYTQAWLSTLIHQDAFQALLQHKQGQTFEEVIIPLAEKIHGVAHRGVERLGEIVDETKDERLVKEITKDMLVGLGYGASTRPPEQTNIQNNTLIVDAQALAEARERRSQTYGGQLEDSSQSENPSPQNEAAQISYSPEPEMGETRDLRSSNVNSAQEGNGESPEGSEV